MSEGKHIGTKLAQIRTAKGMSQEKMALELGVARKTVQNWEKGTSAPSVDQTIKWYHVLGVSPIPYLVEYIYPPRKEEDPRAEEVQMRCSLEKLIGGLPFETVRELLFLFLVDHGSSPQAIMDLITAHLQTPMGDRVVQANIILHNYEMASYKNGLTAPSHVQPDMELLRDAIRRGEQAFIKGASGYILEE